ncbi:MAG: PKD domain-containing protein [Saprospirales bacterium]|nr:PKD domain-containing protein [Saprospirales bacterium]
MLQGLQHLNEAFENVGYYDPATGVNTQIQFCLAKQDPDGLFTTGINHVASPLTNMTMETDDLDVKDLSRWDPLNYINVWIVGEICSNSLGCGVAGYAYFPSSHGSNQDGIVVEAAYLGSSPANSGVLVHEMGHYLGLYHTFEGGCTNDDCLADGDRVCDTPPDQSTAPVPCANPTNSCTTDVNSGFATDQNDMIINYMDYGDLDCYSAFTQGQKDRMGFFIDGARASLLDSPGCNDPCLIPITAAFTPSATLVDVGDPVTFTNTSTGATVFEWQLDGVPFASSLNASYTFGAEGTYLITLIATNADPNCYETFSVEIKVTCPVIANFLTSSTEVMPGTVVYFTNLSQNATQYEWYLDGVLQSNATLWSNLFNSNGTYDVQLVASNANCADTSAITIITVSATGLAQTGLPVWPLASNAGQLSQTIDWQQQPPDIAPIPNGVSLSPGSTGAAFDGCGDLVFYALHTGSPNANNLNLYAPNGTELLSNSTSNGPGLNGVKGGQEIQVVRVPQETNEWYIIYRQWATDAGAPGNSGAYTPNPFLFSRVRLDGNGLVVLQKDIQLKDASGIAHVYNDGAAVSRTAAGNVDAHYLYLARRPVNSTSISLDRFLLTNTGITFTANTGNVPATYWNLTGAGSHIELSPTEDRIAVCNRNQFNNYQDFLLFDAVAFNNTAVQPISCGDLFLVPDGTANDQSNVLPVGGTIQAIASNAGLPLRFLQNFEKKLAPLEFSPNGRFLYVTSGGYAGGGLTNLTYLAQIDLETNPLEVRLQIQTTPGNTYDPISGAGCALANCGNAFRSIGSIESAFDGNLYFVKSGDNTLYVIPDPNNVMPQNLSPSDIDLSTPQEPNLLTSNIISNLPDQIDGFNYFLSQFSEVVIPVGGEDCDGCRAPFEVQILQSGELVETFTVSSCPDTLIFCADTSLVYQLYDPVLGLTFDSAIINAQVHLPPDSTAFNFSDLLACTEICGNNIDDDNDGFIDCADPDLFGDCCCATVLSLDLGPDIFLCANGVVALDAGPGFDTYLWPDLSSQQTFTAYGPGAFWVVATDSCGTVYTDTLVITVDSPTQLDLGPDRTFCENEPGTTFSLTGFASYHWYPDTYLDCDTCATVTAQPNASATYVVVASTAAGCYSVDTVSVSVLDTVLVHLDTFVCDNAAIVYNGQNLAAGSITPFVFEGANGCDSTVVVEVINKGFSSLQVIDTALCAGEIFMWNGQAVAAGNSLTLNLTGVSGCDSTIMIQVGELPNYDISQDYTICEGDSALVFGTYQTQAGTFSQTMQTQAGCDSLVSVVLHVLPKPPVTVLTQAISCFGEADGALTLESTDPDIQYSLNGGPFQAGATFSGLEAGTYLVEYENGNGCIFTLLPQEFLEPLAVVVFLPADTSIQLGQHIGIEALLNNQSGLTFTWTPPGGLDCPVCPDVVASPTQTTQYTLTVQSPAGCAAMDSILIRVLVDRNVYIPTLFRPILTA